ncbi:MAG: UDP-N-acetylmuramoyl-L-alanine--D-glutamate ligase [Lachnospiraceae bacterium]|nr:UDP-N-acetylmuramoyl-L-alanine--D-glutamate ligase [Lachnospiraceae bacterium]
MFDKKVLVAGSGKSGLCASALLARNGEKVILFDENKNLKPEDVLAKIEDVENKDNIEVYIGELTDEIISQCSIMVISPGIPVDAKFALKVKEAGLPIWSEIELAYNYEKGVVAAITGTNGKTTTTTLVGEIIKAWNEETYVVGNIGIPYTKLSDGTTDKSVTVAEISSFQLETIVSFKPHVSAILNVTPDHLDRHYTFENYAKCKLDITKNQTKDDYAVLNYDDPETMKLADKIEAKKIYFSREKLLDEGVFVEDGKIVIKEADNKINVLSLADIKLLGTHNTENVLAAVAVSYYMGVPVDVIEKVCVEFKGVEHRIEYVKTVNGVAYYNDSKGTNPDAAIKAIKAMTTTTLLIGGGYDKQSSYDEWIEAFDNKVKYLVLLGQTAKNITECAHGHGFTKTITVESLKDAVKFCYENAQPGDAVLLSPACASWGMFENYEQRGNMFKEYVREL